MFGKNSSAKLTALGIMAIFMSAQFPLIVNPAMSGISAQFPDVAYSTITMLTTVVSLVAVPFKLVSGGIAGRRFKFRTLAIFALCLIVIGGATPYFLDSFPLIFATRFACGVGLGLAQPLGFALVMRTYTGEKAAKMQGLGSAIGNISAMCLQLLSGWVCTIDVRLAWLVHLVLAIPLVLIIFFTPEPEKLPEVTETGEKIKVRIPLAVILMSAGYGLFVLCANPVTLCMSKIITGEAIGTAADAGVVLACGSVGGMVAGFVIARLLKRFGNYAIPLAAFVGVGSIALAYFGTSVPVMVAAVFLQGFSMNCIWAGCMFIIGEITQPEGMTLASGIFTATMSTFAFVSSLFLRAMGTISSSARFPLLITMCIAAALAVAWTLATVVFSRKQGVREAEGNACPESN